MALSDDQRAMLRLLAQREQGYEDIAALMGLSVDDVRAKVKDALAQLEDEGAAPPPLPPEPQPPVAAEPPAPIDPPPVAAQPPTPAPKPILAAAPAPSAAAKPAPKQPRDRGQLLAIGGGLAAAAVIVVLLVLLLSGSDGDSGDATTAAGDSPAATEQTEQNVAGGREATRATLTAVDGSEAAGSAEFGRVEEELGLGISAEGLAGDEQGQTHMIWLSEPGQKNLLPLTALEVPASGRIEASYQVPTEAVIYMASGDFDRLVITRARSAALRKSLVAANREKDFPAYTGDPVLEGEIVGPIIGAQARLEARQKAKEAE